MEKKLYEIIVAMAEEISKLRANNDLEWGEWDEEEYKVENIIEEYKKEFLED